MTCRIAVVVLVAALSPCATLAANAQSDDGSVRVVTVLEGAGYKPNDQSSLISALRDGDNHVAIAAAIRFELDSENGGCCRRSDRADTGLQ